MATKLQNNRIGGPDGFLGQFYQNFRKEIISNLWTLFQRVGEERLGNLYHMIQDSLSIKPSSGHSKV